MLAETPGNFFEQRGPRQRASVSVVCVDMSRAFKDVVERCLPDAEIGSNHFHVLKFLLDAIEEMCQEACRNTGGVAGHALKNTQFALLRNPKHLRPEDKMSIARVQKTNHCLARAYELCGSFEGLWIFH